MTMLAMALAPKDWTLEIKRMLLFIRPPAIADDVRQQLVRKWKSEFSKRLCLVLPISSTLKMTKHFICDITPLGVINL